MWNLDLHRYVTSEDCSTQNRVISMSTTQYLLSRKDPCQFQAVTKFWLLLYWNESNYFSIISFDISLASLIAQLVKHLSAMQETPVQFWVGKIHWRRDRLPTSVFLGFPCGSAGKEFACNMGDLGSIPGLGRSPEEGKGYPLQYSGLENSMDHTVHGVTKSWTWLSDFYFTLYMYLMFSSKWFMCFFNVSFDFTLIYFSSHSQGEATLLQSFFKIISFYCI